MRVLFDHQAFVMQVHGGVSRCFAELYNHMSGKCETYISINETNNAYLREIGIGNPIGYSYNHFISSVNFPLKGRLFGAYNYLTKGMPYQSDNYLYFKGTEYQKLHTIKKIKQRKFDVFHPTFFDDYFLPFIGNTPFVFTIHDMIPWIYSNTNNESWKWQVEKMKKLAPKASAIISVSENTKMDIIKYLKVPEEKIHVVYHGCSFPKVLDSSRLFAFPYILYVGERSYYKNFNLFVRYIAPILKFHSELMVVCTGKQFSEDEERIFSDCGVRGRFVRHWVETDEEFYSLYHHAVCFVYTSEYEGFGIPILEAYQAECPVMLNNASCFPEIAGDAAVFFEMNNDASDFSEKFEELYSMSDEERSLLLKKQRDRLQFYSWEKSAVQLTDIYRSII